MGGEGKIVEADETYYGNVESASAAKQRTIARHQERQGGPAASARSSRWSSAAVGPLLPCRVADGETVAKIVRENVARESRLHTDESRLYIEVGTEFAAHETVKHSAKEYARGDVTTNTVEGYFSMFKRGMRGIYQHCGEKHLHRYLAEFDFRYNNRAALGINDGERAELALKGIAGKRLTYRLPH